MTLWDEMQASDNRLRKAKRDKELRASVPFRLPCFEPESNGHKPKAKQDPLYEATLLKLKAAQAGEKQKARGPLEQAIYDLTLAALKGGGR